MEITYHDLDKIKIFQPHNLSGVINGETIFEDCEGYTKIRVPFLTPLNDQIILDIFSDTIGDEPRFEPFVQHQHLIVACSVWFYGDFHYLRKSRFSDETVKRKGYIFTMKSWKAGLKRFLWISKNCEDFWQNPFLDQSDYKDSDEELRVWPKFKSPEFFCQGFLKSSQGSRFGTRWTESDRTFIHSDFSLEPFNFESFCKIWKRIDKDLKLKLEFKNEQKARKKAGLPPIKVEPNFSHIFEKQVLFFLLKSILKFKIRFMMPSTKNRTKQMSNKADSDFSDEDEFMKLCNDLIKPKPEHPSQVLRGFERGAETIVISSDNDSLDRQDVIGMGENSSPDLNEPKKRHKRTIVISNSFVSK